MRRVIGIGLHGRQTSAACPDFCRARPRRTLHCYIGYAAFKEVRGKVRSSVYLAYMVIEAIVQGKHSSNHFYSSPVKS